MNANELADYWMNRKFAIPMADETADMLRQQQAEIEALKSANAQLRNRTIWDKPRESQYVQNTRLAAKSGEQG